MGLHDRAEVFEFLGIYLLAKLSNTIDKNDGSLLLKMQTA